MREPIMDNQVQARNINAYRIAGVLAAVMLALIGAGLLNGTRIFTLGLWSALVAICVIAIVLTRRNRRDLGMALILGVVLIAAPFSSFASQGAGVLQGLVVLVISGMCAYLALSPRWRIWALLAGGVSAAMCVLLDVFGSPTRPVVLNFTATVIVALATLGLYSIFLLRHFSKFSIREKIIVVALALTLIPLAILAVINYRASTEVFTQRAGVALKNVADTQAQNISAQLDQEARVLNVLAVDSTLAAAVADANAAYQGDATLIRAELERLDQTWRAADAARNNDDALVASRLNNPAAEVLRRFRAAYPDNVEVFVTDRYGANVAATNRTSDYYQGDEEWWQAAYNNGQGAVYIGQPDFDVSAQTSAINIAAPLYAADGKTVAGIIRTTYSLQAFFKLLAAIHLGQSGHADILLPDNQTIGFDQALYDTTTLDRIRAASDDTVEIVSAVAEPRLYSRAAIQAVTSDAVGAAVANLDWTLLAHQDRAEIVAPVEAQTRGTVILALVIALVGGVIALASAEVLARPIIRLTATAERVRAGDLRARAPVDTEDEIGALATTFNQMTAQLSGLVGNLEQRVADRTIELESNNAYYVSLQDMSVALLKRRDVQTLLQDIIERAGELVGTKNGYVFLLDRATQEMTMRVGIGAYQEFVGTQAKRGNGLAGLVWESGEALAVDDYRTWSGRLADPSRNVLRAVIGVPLKSGDQVIGVIGLAHLEMDKRFGPTEVDVLNRFAALAALVLDNAELLDASRRELTQRENAEKFLDSLIENLPLMLFVKDAQELRFVQWNKTGEELTGHARQDLLGKNDYDLFPQDAESFVAKDREMLASGQTLDIPEEPIQTADGTIRWLHTRKVPIMGADGKPAYLLGISDDITERKRAQEREAFQNALVAAQFQVSPDGILVVGADNQILSFNQRFTEIWGIATEDMTAKTLESLRQLVRPQVLNPEAWLERTDEMYKNQFEQNRDLVELRDGRVYERYSAPVTAADGSYLARISFFHDVTEIRRAESLMRRVSQDTHSIFWSARVTELDDPTAEAAGFRWETEYANLDTTRIPYPLQIAPGASFGDAWYAAWHPDDKHAMNERSAQALRQGAERYTQEFRVIDAEGKTHWMMEEARIHPQSDTEFIVTGVNTEVTEMKAAEAAVREREALYRSLVDVLPQSLTRKDRQGRVTFGNTRYFEDTLLKPEGLYGKTDFDFHPRELAEKYWQDDLRVLRGGETVDTIEPHQRGDGVDIMVRVLKTPIYNDMGEIDGIQTMFWDITEEQQRQEQLNRQNDYLNALQEISLDLMQRLDVNAVLHDIVARAGQLVGTENGYVYLQAPDADEMELRVGVGAYEGFVGRRTKPGVGLAGEVWANRAPVVVQDYREYGGRLQDASRDILRAVIGVPLRSGDDVIGVIGLAYLDPKQKFGEQEIQALERFAQLAVIALDNARLYESSQSELAERTRAEAELAIELRETELLGSVTRHAVNLDVSEALNAICRDLGEFFGVNETGIALLNEDKTAATVVADFSPEGSPDVRGYTIPVQGNPSAEIVLETRRAVAFADAQTDPRLAAVHELMRLRGTVSILIAPLFRRDEVIGTLGIDSLTRREFSAREIALVERVGASVSTALENARLYDLARAELAERTRAEQLIAAQAERIRSLFDLSLELGKPEAQIETLLDLICGRTKRLLNVDGADIWIPVGADELEIQVSQNVGPVSLGGRRLKRGEGLAGRAMAAGTALRVDDYRTWALRSEQFADAPFHAAIGIPMIWQGETVGVLTATHSQPEKRFTEEDEQIGKLLATQAAAAIRNARLFTVAQQEIAERTRAEADLASELRQTELVNRVTHHAVSFDVDRALSAICSDLAAYFGAEQAGIALLEPDKQTLVVAAAHQPEGSPSTVGYNIPVAGNPSTEIVLETRRPAAFSDAQHDPRMAAVHDLMKLRQTASLLLAPLFVRDEIIGTVGIGSRRQREFSQADLDLVERVARSISTALENARLYQRVQQELGDRTRAEMHARQRNIELESLNRVAATMMSDAPIEDSLAQMAKELVQTFRARNCGIALLNSERTDLVVVADALAEEHEQHAVGIVIPVQGNRSSEYVIKNKKSLIITDPQNDPLTASIHERMRDRHTTCLAIIPLLSGEMVIGTIGLDTTEAGRVFTADEIRVAETMASQMANALEKQRLLEETQREVVRRTRAEQIQSALFRIADAVNTAATTDAFYAALHEIVAELVYAPNMYVALYHANEDALEFPYFVDTQDTAPTLNARNYLPAGKRITAWVIKHGQPLLGDAPTLRAMMERGEIELFGIVSFEWLGIPLKRGAETFGMFAVQSYDEAHSYAASELEMLLALAPEISNAITRRQEQEALALRNRELATVNRVTQLVTTSGELSDMLGMVAREMVDVFNARNCGIALFTPDRAELVVMASASSSADQPEALGVRIPIVNNPSTQRVLETREPLVIENAQTDPLTEPIHALMRERRTFGLMIVPLLSSSQVIGTVGLDLDVPSRFFTLQDARLAETIANQMANALEKQRLFGQTQERARREQLTREIGAHMTRSLDLEQILQTTARELSHALGASHAVVRIGASEKQSNGGHE